MIYIAQHDGGYCGTFDAKEKDNHSISTFCGFFITLPLSIEEYSEDFEPEGDLKLCRWCRQTINVMNSCIDVEKLIHFSKSIPIDTVKVLFNFASRPKMFTETQKVFYNQLITKLGIGK